MKEQKKLDALQKQDETIYNLAILEQKFHNKIEILDNNDTLQHLKKQFELEEQEKELKHLGINLLS